MARTAICPECGGPKYPTSKVCRDCKPTAHSEETKAKISAGKLGTGIGPRTSTPQDGHSFAERHFPLPDLCERCEKVPPIDRHHRDGNPQNCTPENIRFLCRRCHQIEDGRHEFVKNEMPRMGARARNRLKRKDVQWGCEIAARRLRIPAAIEAAAATATEPTQLALG